MLSDYAQKICQILEIPSPKTGFEYFGDMPSVLKRCETDSLPHVVLLKAECRDLARAQNFLQKLRSLDGSLCLFVLVSDPPCGADSVNWLDAGASCILSQTLNPNEITEGLKEILSRRLAAHRPRAARLPVKHKIKIRCASLEQALVAETLNLGTGGMFVRTLPQGVQVGDLVEFNFELSRLVSDAGAESSLSNPLVAKMETTFSGSGPLELDGLAGQGVIAWVRNRALPGTPEGLGIQFLDLSPKARQMIQEFLHHHGSRSFIPKG